MPEAFRPLMIGLKHAKHGCTALVRAEDAQRLPVPVLRPDLDAIMVHMEKENDQ